MSTFPEQIDSFIEAVDLSTAQDSINIQNYQTAIENNNYALAQTILGAWTQGKNKQLNAMRFNELASAIIAIETFYKKENGVKAEIDQQVNSFTYIGEWLSTTNYLIGRIAIHNDEFGNPTWYQALQPNINIEPQITSGWETSWKTYLTPNRPKQYPVQSTEPVGQQVGELWWDTTP